MRTLLPTYWRKIQKYLFLNAGTVLASVFVVALIVVIFLGYWFNWDWTGLGSYNPPAQEDMLQRGKTLWDWLQLLIVPAVLALGGVWFNQIQKRREQQAIKQQAELERERTHDNQQEILLQTYIDKMAELLVEKHLRASQQGDEVRNVARVRTLMALSRLDGVRKGIVLRFLHESGLIEGIQPIIQLGGADFCRVDVREADLHHVNLRQANLRQAILRRVDLRGAILSKTDLEEADLHGSILQMADLSAANLQRADLEVADVRGAMFVGADLRGALISSAQLASVKNAQAITIS